MAMEMRTEGPVKTRREGAVLEVTLDRPKANAIDLQTSRIMGLVFRDFRDDDSLRVCILRSAGENPDATTAVGVRVAPLRYAGVAISGTLAGLSGAFLAIEVNELYHEGQTQGMGFIALAALILGNWRPVSLMLGALLFVLVVAGAGLLLFAGFMPGSRGANRYGPLPSPDGRDAFPLPGRDLYRSADGELPRA